MERMIVWMQQQLQVHNGNMLKFPAQLHNFRKVAIGDNIISLSIDKAYSDQIIDVVKEQIGTEFIVYLEKVTNESSLNEDNVELKDRFWRKMHILITELAEKQGIKKEDCKDIFKKQLIKIGAIKESTKELDVKGLAKACNLLEELINKK